MVSPGLRRILGLDLASHSCRRPVMKLISPFLDNGCWNATNLTTNANRSKKLTYACPQDSLTWEKEEQLESDYTRQQLAKRLIT